MKIYALNTDYDGIVGYYTTRDIAMKVAKKIFDNHQLHSTEPSSLEEWMDMGEVYIEEITVEDNEDD